MTAVFRRQSLVFGFALLYLFLSGCNSIEGELPQAGQLDYPDLEFEKVGEVNVGINGIWRDLDYISVHYAGQRPYLFFRMFEQIVCVEPEKMEVSWIKPETILGPVSHENYDITLFDWGEDMILTNGHSWVTLDPATGDIRDSKTLINEVPEYTVYGYNFIAGKAYFFTRNFDTKEARVYVYDYPTEELRLLHSYRQPNLYTSRSSSRLFPFDAAEGRLLLPFPLEDEGDSPGAYFLFLNIRTNNIDSFYLDGNTYEERAIEIENPIFYKQGIISFSSLSRSHVYDLRNNKNIRSIRTPDNTIDGDFIMTWGDGLRVFGLQSGEELVTSASRYQIITSPAIHPTEDVVIVPLRNRILLVEVVSGRQLMEYPIAEQDTPYEAIFFDAEGRLCLLGRDQRLEFFELPI